LLPESGWVVEKLDDPQVREIVYGNYRIIYRHRNRLVEILTVCHGARLLPKDFPERH
jgi:toxin ParE1/3/4